MIGKALREKREAMGISLEEASSRTQIKMEFLRSLEDETFELLPDPHYLSGFLRRYAHYLELDEDALVETFQEQISRPLIAKFRPFKRETASTWKRWRGSLLLILSVLLLFTLYYQLYHISNRARRDVASRLRPTVTREKLPSARETKAPGLSFPAPAVSPLPTTPPREGGHTLSFRALEKTWLVIQADDGPPREMLLAKGQSFSLSAQRQFLLTLGNAGGVEMVLDGKRLPIAGPSGQVIRDLILPPKNPPSQSVSSEKASPDSRP